MVKGFGEGITVSKVSEKVIARAKAVQILKKIPVFNGLLEDEYFKVLGMCTSAAARAGEVLFEQGDAGKSMYILLSGEMKVDVKGVGTVHTMSNGEIVGEISLVKNIKRTASVIANTDCVLLQLYSEIFHEVVKKQPRVGYLIMRNIARILADRLVQTNKSSNS